VVKKVSGFSVVALLATVLTVGVASPASAATQATVGGVVYSLNNAADPALASVISANPPATGAVTIPETFFFEGKTYTVTDIGFRAFANSSATSVNIPNTVTRIGQEAFQGASALSSVTMGSGVTSIGDDAFANTPLLTTVDMLGPAPTLGNTSLGSIGDSGPVVTRCGPLRRH
jgi:hypothetical protein